MTAQYEARSACPIPSRQDCLTALAETSAEIQQQRWELLLAAGPEETARQVWQPWMHQTEQDLAERYAAQLARAGAA